MEKRHVKLKCSDAQILLKDKRKTLLRCCIELYFPFFFAIKCNLFRNYLRESVFFTFYLKMNQYKYLVV